MHGGAADRSGLIHVGDEVVEVNNINVEGKTPGDVLQILVSNASLRIIVATYYFLIGDLILLKAYYIDHIFF